MDRVSQAVRPDGRPQGYQSWQHLLFLHWEVPAETIQRTLPAGLEVDTFEGRAFLGVVPFTMKDVSPWWAPSVPGVSNFHEVNVRTYVHRKGRDPAVWFYSLDAANRLAVLIARLFWHLPYHRAKMSLSLGDGQIGYSSERTWPKPLPAAIDVRYEIGARLGPLDPESLEHFLAERYLLYAARGERLFVGQVHHKPYPLHRARVLDLRQTMTDAAGFPDLRGEPLAHYAPGVDVDVYALGDVAKASGP